MKTTGLVAALLLQLPVMAAGQRTDRAQMQYDSAYCAWREGKYPVALARLRRVLVGADAARFTEPAALLTGELYRSIEVVPTQRYVINVAANAPRWSPDGRHFIFE